VRNVIEKGTSEDNEKEEMSYDMTSPHRGRKFEEVWFREANKIIRVLRRLSAGINSQISGLAVGIDIPL